MDDSEYLCKLENLLLSLKITHQLEMDEIEEALDSLRSKMKTVDDNQAEKIMLVLHMIEREIKPEMKFLFDTKEEYVTQLLAKANHKHFSIRKAELTS